MTPGERLRAFFRLESTAALLLGLAAIIGIVAANSPLAPWYDAFLDLRGAVTIGTFKLDKPLLIWINDGLMAIFFLHVGLEIKREIVDGELAAPAQALLPALAALAGMAVPAAIYLGVSRGDPAAVDGWAIPGATDIAFSLGVLGLLGARIPLSLKVFLTAVAIYDDLGAIAIIAGFYTDHLSVSAMLLAAVALGVLFALNLAGVTRIAPYIVVGILLWVFVLKSGVHATLAGVFVALAIPVRHAGAPDDAPLHRLWENLHPWVAYAILPLFAFANTGVSLAGIGAEQLGAPVTLGIALGLFLGKQIGIFAAVYLTVRLGLAHLPEGASWPMLYGVALLCGIGFTMSLFIGTLAFEDAARAAELRLGVLAGSMLSAVAGYAVLRATAR